MASERVPPFFETGKEDGWGIPYVRGDK
jgi:hypothetical protein